VFLVAVTSLVGNHGPPGRPPHSARARRSRWSPGRGQEHGIFGLVTVKW